MGDKHQLSPFLMNNKISLPCPLSIYCTAGLSSDCWSEDVWNSFIVIFLFVLIHIPVFDFSVF